MTKPKWKEAKKILERMNYDENYAYSYEFEDVEIITEAFDEINKENTNIEKELKKANDRIYELGRCIKDLHGFNRNKQNIIKDLESKLEKKDKALQKACELIENLESEEVRFCTCPVESYNYTPECCNEDFCNGCNSKCWKDWFEHEN